MSDIGRFGRKVISVVVATCAAVSLAACSETQPYRYLSDSVSGTIVQIPAEWAVLEGDELLAVTAQRLPERDNAVFSRWLYGFSADGAATGETLLSATQTKPGGMVRSRYLTQAELVEANTNLTVRKLLDLVNDMALLPAAGDVIDRKGFGVITESGVNGIGYTILLRTPDGEMRLRYIAVIDPRVGQMNTLLIGCSVACFEEWASVIDQVSERFTVVDPEMLR